MLPIGKTLTYRVDSESPFCESCTSNSEETFEHMICCPGLHCWRASKENNLALILEKLGTSHFAKQIILGYLFDGKSRATASHVDTRQITHDFALLGKHEIWKGRIPSSLVHHEHVLLSRSDSSRPIGREGETWAKRTIRAIFLLAIDLWHTRNHLRYDKNEEDMKRRRMEIARKRCASMRERIKRLNPSDRRLFESDEACEKMDRNHLDCYLNWALPLLEKCEENIQVIRSDRSRSWDATEGEIPIPP